MKPGGGQKRPAGDSGQKRKMRKANARTAPGRVNRPGKAVIPAQERPAQKRISDEGPPGSKRLKVADKMPGAKRRRLVLLGRASAGGGDNGETASPSEGQGEGQKQAHLRSNSNTLNAAQSADPAPTLMT